MPRNFLGTTTQMANLARHHRLVPRIDSIGYPMRSDVKKELLSTKLNSPSRLGTPAPPTLKFTHQMEVPDEHRSYVLTRHWSGCAPSPN